MADDQFPKHAVRIRWRSFQAEIIGLPAIVLVGAAVLILVVNRLPDWLNYLPRLPW
jgi:hypothetical protein